MHIQNSDTNIGNDEIIKKEKLINILLIAGFIIDFVSYFIITRKIFSPILLHEYYSEHKFLIQIIYLLGGFILLVIFSSRVFYKFNFKNKTIPNFSKVQVK